ncbi:MAG: ribulose-phosphate 3-epimerase [Chloroflexi bacterium]|nr:ribulose-phosphate 3-epimerase [Chloroflexota bacterium]
MVKIAPSILSADFARLGEQLWETELAGADYVHVDVMDGRFVPNITVGPLVVAAARQATHLPLDVHLMVEEPERHVEAFVEAGADVLTVHVEACTHLHRLVHRIRDLGARPGVSLNPSTPAGALEEILGDVDLVLVMTVNPGFGGQQYIPQMLGKVQRIAGWVKERGLTTELAVDGGMTAKTAPAVVQAGATFLVAGSAIYGAPDGIAAALSRLRQAAEGALQATGRQP